MHPYADVVTQYAEFAGHAHESPCFTDWALRVADDAEVAAWINTLPGLKRQPNLVFAAARWHGVPAPGRYDGLREALLGDDGTIRGTILSRATQTNEVGRLATLLPAFAVLAGGEPLALLEAGASAGLNLFPDRWGYTWTGSDAVVEIGPEPRLRCAVTGPAPLPAALPVVAWRGGIDLNPLDVHDDDAMAWLETLVWPEDEPRRVQLRRAVDVARLDPPRVERGNLLTGLADLVTEAARHALVVVFHSAVAAYLTDEDRLRFDDLMRGLVADGACHWVSNEAPPVLTSVTATLPVPVAEPTFVLGIDGRAVALTHGHGRTLDWVS